MTKVIGTVLLVVGSLVIRGKSLVLKLLDKEWVLAQ